MSSGVISQSRRDRTLTATPLIVEDELPGRGQRREYRPQQRVIEAQAAVDAEQRHSSRP
jgi:hypothetical protein